MSTEAALEAAPTPIAHKAFSFARVRAIAGNTLLELVRLKVFYFLLLFALLLIGSSLYLVKLTFQEQFQVLKDVSLGAMSIFSWLLAVLATAMLVPKDLEDRTLYTILAKPVPRFEYLLGKLLGVITLLFLALLAMTAFFLAILYFREQTVLAETAHSVPPQQMADALAEVRNSAFNINLLPGIVAIFVKSALCASLTLFLSSFATSWIFTVLTSMMVYLIGHMQGLAREQWLNQEAPSVFLKGFLMVVALLFPDLQIFSLVDDVAAGTAVPAFLFWRMFGLGSIYTVIYLMAGYAMFSKREL
jgi:ABC-type Na+ efflux pump permease subunit